MPAKIRKLIVQVDETLIEMGKTITPPTRRALAMAVIENPCAGRYVENLDELIAIGEELGALLGNKCVQALGIAPGAALQRRPSHLAMSAAFKPPTRECTRAPVLITRMKTISSAAGAPGTRTSIASKWLRT